MNEDKWDARYLKLADEVAGWSKDTAKVGAVIVRNNRVVATGFNGFPSGVHDSDVRLQDKEMKRALVVHAEENALITAGKNADGATIYVRGKPVCARCAGSLMQAGVRRVVGERPGDSEGTWDKLGRLALEMFDEKGIKYKLIKPSRPRRCGEEPVAAETVHGPRSVTPSVVQGGDPPVPREKRLRPVAQQREGRRRRAGGR